MSSEPPRQPNAPRPGLSAGLCDTCEHQVEVRNTRGSVFSLCARSRTDPAYPRYPRLPVAECDGYEQRQNAS
jgi:hypothetical protein